MDSIWSGQFWKATLERTIGTSAEAALAVIGVDGLGIADLPDEAWWVVAGAAAATVLKALATNLLTKNGPGIGDAETLTQPAAPVVTETRYEPED